MALFSAFVPDTLGDLCHSLSVPFFPLIYKTGIRLSGPRELHGREDRKNVRASGSRGESPEILTSGYGMANTHINSWQLWLPAHD